MNKIQISETVNSTSSIMNFSNNSENLISLSQINNPNIQSTIITSKLPQETPLSTKGNVKSYCRIRPNLTIYSTINRFKTENNNKTLIVDFTSDLDKNNPSKQFIYKYNFTEIFWTSVDNQEIYEKVCKQSIQELFSMHKNALIFVYGITNSGKTYTVNGNMKTPGILQLSLISLFKEYKKLKANNDCWQLSCTYIEIYNEEVFDLLSKDRKKIKIVGGGNKFYSQGNIIKTIDSVQDFTEALNPGENNRTKAETNANPYSSRSHSIFRVELSYQDKDGFCFIEPVSLCIVDLAGAERVSKSGVIGTNLKEAGNINSSLLVLKKCFDAMEANSRTNMVDKKIIVPVRESKLTMLFKEYFAAHQNISVICTINPDRNELMDIRSVLNFGAKAMKVKPVKSWIPTYNYSSKEVSPNKTGSRGNSPFVKDTKKKYRLLTEKKYLEKKFNNNNINNNNYNYNNHYLQNSSSRENVCKFKEDNINNINTINLSNDYSSTKKIIISSEKKIQNIKILKYKKHEYNTQPHVLTLHNEIANKSKNEKDENKTLIEERMKCYNNPFQLVTSKTNNFFMKNSPSKEKLKMEKELKEKRDKEIKDKISKNKEDIKNLVINIFNKKMYYKNLEQNIDIYEKQCRNIDLNEVEALLAYNNGNNFYSLKNPFAKIYEEDKQITLSKSHPINLAYFNVVKEKILKNENNINISFKPSKKNQNLQIISNYNIGYLPEKNNNNNNEFDIFRGGKELIEELQLKLNNSDHDQSKIMEFLDKSFEQYNASQFKAYFGIGKSLVKKLDEGENNEIDKEKKINLKKDIEMIDKIDKAENDENINFNMNNIAFDFLSNEYNFKGKGKDINNNDKKKISKKSKNEENNKEINEEKNDDNNDDNDKEDKKKKKKNKENKSKNNKKSKKRGKKKKITESDIDEEKGDESDKENEKEEIKSKERKKKKKQKKGKSKEKEIEVEKKSDDEEKSKDEELSAKDDEEKEDEEEKQKVNSREEDSEEDKEIEIKSRKRKKNISKKKKASKRNNKSKKRKKPYNNEDESDKEKSEEKNEDDDNSEKEEEERKVKKKNKKKRKNKKKKIIESDIDSSDDLSEENENIKPIRKNKSRTKKHKK